MVVIRFNKHPLKFFVKSVMEGLERFIWFLKGRAPLLVQHLQAAAKGSVPIQGDEPFDYDSTSYPCATLTTGGELVGYFLFAYDTARDLLNRYKRFFTLIKECGAYVGVRNVDLTQDYPADWSPLQNRFLSVNGEWGAIAAYFMVFSPEVKEYLAKQI